jgi:plastocyanin
VSVPRFLLAIPIVVLGAVAPGFTRSEPHAGRPDLVGMTQVGFDRDVVTLDRGDRIDFVNNSNFLHVIGPGHRARLGDETGVPPFGPDQVRTLPRGDPFTTEPWDDPGTYGLTCTLHPEMNLEVVVV